jgi:hypothetical protein
MPMKRHIVLPVLTGLIAGPAALVAAPIPEEYVVGRAPVAAASPIERARAVDGNQYTVVAPIYAGADGNASYLRLFNGDVDVVPFKLTIVGSPSGRVYGTATYTVPTNASPQYAFSDILKAAGAGSLTGGDTAYAVYMVAPAQAQNNGFQHVIYNGSNGFFENVSACTYSPNVDYTGYNQLLINVHTTRLSGFPVQITVHNLQNVAADYDIDVFDAKTGDQIGTVTLSTTPNTSYTLPESYFEKQLDFTPASDQLHLVMRVNGQSATGGPGVVISQAIQNTRLNALINMSLICSVNQ